MEHMWSQHVFNGTHELRTEQEVVGCFFFFVGGRWHKCKRAQTRGLASNVLLLYSPLEELMRAYK